MLKINHFKMLNIKLLHPEDIIKTLLKTVKIRF